MNFTHRCELICCPLASWPGSHLSIYHKIYLIRISIKEHSVLALKILVNNSATKAPNKHKSAFTLYTPERVHSRHWYSGVLKRCPIFERLPAKTLSCGMNLDKPQSMSLARKIFDKADVYNLHIPRAVEKIQGGSSAYQNF